jgi:hypothetical protein
MNVCCSHNCFCCLLQYHNGKHVRDLSKLNRDLSQVLFVSGEPDRLRVRGLGAYDGCVRPLAGAHRQQQQYSAVRAAVRRRDSSRPYLISVSSFKQLIYLGVFQQAVHPCSPWLYITSYRMRCATSVLFDALFCVAFPSAQRTMQ